MKNNFAVIYDFDGTLCPGSMQDYTILPEIGVTGEEFWEMVEKEKKAVKGDPTLTYMRVLMDVTRQKGFKMTRERLINLAPKIKFFDGVLTFFSRINRLVKKISSKINLKHYVISSGLKELIEGSNIADNFGNIFASEYHYGPDGTADFPKFCINSTDKTQYLFRINKGLEEQGPGLHSYMAPEERPVPLSNMIYIGDGMTDVPCMKIIRQHGGAAFSVYDPYNLFSVEVRDGLLRDGRVDGAFVADYSGDGEIEEVVIKSIKSRLTVDSGRLTVKNNCHVLAG